MRRARPDAGLTLVELMITMIVAALVASSTFVFFTGQQRIYDTQNGLLNVQQNLWAAMETLSRHVRANGGGMLGCVRPDSDGGGPDLGDPPPTGASAPLTGLRAYRTDLGVTRIAPLWIRNGAGGTPDTLTVAFGDGSFGTFNDATLALDVDQDQPAAIIRTMAGESRSFRTNEFALLVNADGQANDDRGCTLFQITGIDLATDTLFHASSSTWNPAGNLPNLVPFDYPGGTVGADGVVRAFGQLTWVQFAIDSTGAPRAPRLTMNRLDGTNGPQVLAEGIEDLQIAYACDTLPAGAPDGVLTEAPGGSTADEWIFNATGDVEPAGCQRPAAVRITIVGRALTSDISLNATGNARPAVEDGAAGTTDLFRHRVMTSTIYLRN